jgi:hypothetical protein
VYNECALSVRGWRPRFSLGVGAALAIVFTMAVNLSLTPALLLHYPEFFADRRVMREEALRHSCGASKHLCRYFYFSRTNLYL